VIPSTAPSFRLTLLLAALIALCAPARAQDQPGRDDTVRITALRNPVDKPYRRMIAGVERFESRRALAPAASLRFKLLPRNRATRMDDIALEIVGDTFIAPIDVAQDHSFVLPRHPAALRENASVRPNRKAGTMTWRAEIRSPGVAPGTRRLGDLRLECEIGMEAGLISNTRPSLLASLVSLVGERADYCHRERPRYLFFAERPLFGVALVSGARREVLPAERLYAGASRDPDWKSDLPYCDCEVLLDRTYFLPLSDASWPHDTRIEFEYMEPAPAGPALTKDELRPARAEATVIAFDSGYEVWVFRETSEAAPPVERVLLFDPAGRLSKARAR
jgi:hypothetical protein